MWITAYLLYIRIKNECNASYIVVYVFVIFFFSPLIDIVSDFQKPQSKWKNDTDSGP